MNESTGSVGRSANSLRHSVIGEHHHVNVAGLLRSVNHPNKLRVYLFQRPFHLVRVGSIGMTCDVDQPEVYACQTCNKTTKASLEVAPATLATFPPVT